MSFLRHARSIGPMWAIRFAPTTAKRCRLPGHGRRLPATWSKDKVTSAHRLEAIGAEAWAQGRESIAPLLIVRDESHRLFLGGLLSSRARLRFTGYRPSSRRNNALNRQSH
jgi:hypothetical protein